MSKILAKKGNLPYCHLGGKTFEQQCAASLKRESKWSLVVRLLGIASDARQFAFLVRALSDGFKPGHTQSFRDPLPELSKQTFVYAATGIVFKHGLMQKILEECTRERQRWIRFEEPAHHESDTWAVGSMTSLPSEEGISASGSRVTSGA